MTDLPWLTVLGGLPLLGALAVAFVPRGRELLAKQLALLVSLVVLAGTVALGLAFDPAGPQFQFVEQHAWIPAFGVSYAVGVDGIALVLVALAAVLTPVCILASWHDVRDTVGGRGGRREQTFFALLLVLETAMIGVFAAVDVFLFYVFFEAMLIPMYFLIGSFGGPRRSYAAVKFLLYSLFGGLLMLAAVIGLYVAGPGGPDGFLFTR
ncbi:MAG: NADH-quinone oxidoreductase subunit M, partial [Actinomycetota bacterium]|nr:NADH-quinone oxidoreductase subunit M [Actinomycetota bacterium]